VLRRLGTSSEFGTPMLACREIETLKEKDSFIHRERGDIYRRQGGYMDNNPILITQLNALSQVGV